ncbi:glycoside hydrolase/phage tail family protein [Stappia sp.]|uniref:baseplate multidomain protein megatron n=1 Tax=Stappia sp. TaxID=1870903 RepID=UPI0032D9585E
MATLILAAAGKAIGGAVFGGAGAILGQAAGALAGSVIDDALFGTSQVNEGRRLADLSIQSSTEGASLPKVYGRVRLAGQVIWATRLEEEVREQSQGGKGGGGARVTQRSYHYYASFAVALCEGPVARIGAVWADGKPMDLDGVTWRVHHGTANQPADPLIAALQGETPAYRNVAYVVFERLPLDLYGDRLPQLTFEVIRAVEPLEALVRAITVIPGAGEFVYAPLPVTWSERPGVAERINRHVTHADSNWTASLDELQALCPNLEQVALVVSWFGDDLRCGTCTVRPRVETQGRATSGMTWSVSGETTATAAEVSRAGDRPAYGGTPADESVIRAIQDLKARGLKVALHPFILMDVPAGNALPDPYGGTEQAPHPWRGRITASLAPGLPGTPDGTGAVTAELDAFVGTAAPGDFLQGPNGVGYAGPAEWSFRRFVLHHAHLAAAAGGVDTFLIASELRGLTRLRSGSGVYPFVAALKALASEVQAILPGAAITYGADWTEYGAHQVGAGELRFPLDPLWADPAISAVGINAYFPLADMREEGDPDGNIAPHDAQALHAAVAGGEDYDWFYASEADRLTGVRTPIADGAYGKPWVYRAKDLVGWWSNPHVERVGGAELATATDWAPQTKPIWLTELGVPAIDRGANQPNIFFDEKSSESGWPRFSNGGRDDLIQRRALEAVLAYWSGDHPALPAGANPVSPVYGGPMLDAGGIFLWCWDARPYPAFPGQLDVWSDGENWRAGHWLTGRLGGVSLAGLIGALATDYGLSPDVYTVETVPGTIDGLAVAGPSTLRAVLAPLLEAHGVVAADLGPRIGFRPAWSPVAAELGGDDLVVASRDEPVLSSLRAQAADLPAEVRISARDGARDHRRYVVSSRRREGHSVRVEEIDLAATLDPGIAAGLADGLLVRRWSAREELRFVAGPAHLALEPGDVVRLAADPQTGLAQAMTARIESLEEAGALRIVAREARPPLSLRARRVGGEGRAATVRAAAAAPDVLILDLPPLPGTDEAHAPRMAAFARPWPGGLDVYRAREGGSPGFLTRLDRPAVMGETTQDLVPGPVAVWDRMNVLEVEISDGTLDSAGESEVLGGANPLAVLAPDGGLEIVQFARAELVGPRRYRLSDLIRGGLGTEAAAARVTPAGARVVLLDDAVAPLPLKLDEIGIAFDYAVLPAGQPLDSLARRNLSHVAKARGLKPFAPSHLSARRLSGGDVRFSWVRRTRIGGDGWRETDVPIGEERERYRAELLGAGDLPVWSREVDAPQVDLGSAEEISIFGGPASTFRLRVVQISAVVGDSLPAVADLTV